jgi:hypothetical protein
MTPKRLYNFRIDPDLDAGLKAVKDRDGIPESEQIRRALREWLERRGVIEKADRKRVTSRKRS